MVIAAIKGKTSCPGTAGCSRAVGQTCRGSRGTRESARAGARSGPKFSERRDESARGAFSTGAGCARDEFGSLAPAPADRRQENSRRFRQAHRNRAATRRRIRPVGGIRKRSVEKFCARNLPLHFLDHSDCDVRDGRELPGATYFCECGLGAARPAHDTRADPVRRAGLRTCVYPAGDVWSPSNFATVLKFAARASRWP